MFNKPKDKLKNDDFSKLEDLLRLACALELGGENPKALLTFFYLDGKILTWNSDISAGFDAAEVSLVTQLADALPLK